MVRKSRKVLSRLPESKTKLPKTKILRLEPAGYPLRAKGMEALDFIQLETDHPRLFELYARSQWRGISISKGDFLFDAMMFPDFAFRVTGLNPNPSEISNKTRIRLEKTGKQRVQKSITRSYSPIKFDEIIGQEVAKEKCRVILKFLTSEEPSLWKSSWFPKNVLFQGPPGTGKTMMARALASQSGIPLLLISATELIGVFVGEGSKKIQKLYNQARKFPKGCIIFIDEFDSIALNRSYQNIRGDVMEIVAALLTEMDGLRDNTRIVTIAATNFLKELDPAILSRFEQLIEFKLPSLKERETLLESKAKSSPIPFNCDFHKIALLTEKWSFRDLVEKLLKNAVHKAILRDDKSQPITIEDLKPLILPNKVISNDDNLFV